MLEWVSQVAATATRTASSGSLASAVRRVRKVGDWASGAAAAFSSISDSRISPIPTRMRPILRARSIASWPR